MIWPSYLSAFLSLATLGLAFFCWRRRHLALALPSTVLYFCLALTLTFNALTLHFLFGTEISDPALVLAKIIFWSGWFLIAIIAVTSSTLWLVLSWRPLSWPASWQRLLTAALVLIFLISAYLRLFRPELLVTSIDYDPGSHLLRFQLTVLGKCWTFSWGLIQLTSLSWLLLGWIQSSSPSQRRQAKWLYCRYSSPCYYWASYFYPHSCDQSICSTLCPGC